MRPEISVILATYSDEDYEDYCHDCIESILNQTYTSFELIIVTENKSVEEKIREDFNDYRLKIIDFKQSGISKARNRGAEISSGDILVFTDDDVVAEEDWLEHIKNTYDRTDCVGVSGMIEPLWENESLKKNVPEEFYWVVGATYRGYGNEGEIVRNPFGPNMSIRKKIFERIGGFEEELGKEKSYMMQGEESELGSRLRNELDRGFYYEPEAKVYHHVERDQTKLSRMLKRCFYQGYSKGLMSENTFEKTLEKEEVSFINNLITDYLPEHLKNRNIRGFIVSILLSLSVGLGFSYYKFKNILKI